VSSTPHDSASLREASYLKERRVNIVVRLLAESLVVVVLMAFWWWGMTTLGSDSLQPMRDPLYVAGCPLADTTLEKGSAVGGCSKEGVSHTQSGCILPSMSEKRNSQEKTESQRLESLYRKAADPVLRTHLLMVWRMSVGDSVGAVAEMVGYSKKWTKEIKRRYESEGVKGLGDRRHSNPGAKERALLDEEGQAQLRQALLEGSPPGGGMWSGAKVARWIEQRNGLEKVHDQRGFEYLRKVGMSPQVPRPSNAQGADSQEREAFKNLLG
jgi:transposase